MRIDGGVVNKHFYLDAESISPLVGLHQLPERFRFQVNMYQFDQMRAHFIISKACLSELFDVMGVGQCPELIHEAIHQQLYTGQVNFPWICAHEKDVVLQVFKNHGDTGFRPFGAPGRVA